MWGSCKVVEAVSVDGLNFSPDISISLLIPRLQKRSKLEKVKTVESLVPFCGPENI
jgi:hypothetical protein